MSTPNLTVRFNVVTNGWPDPNACPYCLRADCPSPAKCGAALDEPEEAK